MANRRARVQYLRTEIVSQKLTKNAEQGMIPVIITIPTLYEFQLIRVDTFQCLQLPLQIKFGREIIYHLHPRLVWYAVQFLDTNDWSPFLKRIDPDVRFMNQVHKLFMYIFQDFAIDF